RSLWSSSVLSAVSCHLLYRVRSLWSSPVLCPQSLVISCTVSAVSGHLLYRVRSLWSSPVLCPHLLIVFLVFFLNYSLALQWSEGHIHRLFFFH
ncbi:unnamed protein product, partial [Staurois parvus]